MAAGVPLQAGPPPSCAPTRGLTVLASRKPAEPRLCARNSVRVMCAATRSWSAAGVLGSSVCGVSGCVRCPAAPALFEQPRVAELARCAALHQVQRAIGDVLEVVAVTG